MTFQFPKENQDAYLGTVTFRRIIYTPPDFIPRGFEFTRGPGTLANFSEATAIAAGVGDSDANAAIDLNDADVGGEIVTAATEEVDFQTGIKLYLPQSISINDGVNYETLDLGPIGGIAEAGIKQGQGALASIRSGVTQATQSTIDLIKGDITAGAAGRLAAVRLAEKFAPSGVVGSVRSGFATAVNPNTRSLFKSVNLREFSFTFTMIANSSDEAVEIDNIINFFREELYPSTAADVNGVSIGYNFPNKFQITFEYNDNQVGTKILPSHLRNVQTVYNPNSMGWHVDGKPSEVQLTLTFGESRTLTKADIREGF